MILVSFLRPLISKNNEDCFLFERKLWFFAILRRFSCFRRFVLEHLRTFRVLVTPLNVNKMAVSGWISLKFGISGLYTTKFCMKKKIPKKWIFRPGTRKNWKKLLFLAKKRKNAKIDIFSSKMGEIVPNMDFNKHLGII